MQPGAINNETVVSIHCIDFNVNNARVALRVPTTTLTDGYDSENECGPFFDAVYGEASEEESDGEDETPPAQTETNLTADPETLPLTEEKIKKMNVVQLKEELKKRKKSQNGIKKVLQECLLGAVNAPVGMEDNKE